MTAAEPVAEVVEITDLKTEDIVMEVPAAEPVAAPVAIEVEDVEVVEIKENEFKAQPPMVAETTPVEFAAPV